MTLHATEAQVLSEWLKIVLYSHSLQARLVYNANIMWTVWGVPKTGEVYEASKTGANEKKSTAF